MRVVSLLLALSLAIASGTGVGATVLQKQQGEQDISELLVSDLGNHGRGLKQFGFFSGRTNIIDFLFGNAGAQPVQSTPLPLPPQPQPQPQPQQRPQQQPPPPPPPPPPPQQQSTPSQSAPIEQQAPPPQLTGPRFTPAPAVYTPTTLPTYPPLGRKNGPMNPSALSNVFPTPQGECKTLGEVLAAIPEASQWLDLLTQAGGNVLLNDKNSQATLLVPVNSAFRAGIDAQPLRAEETMQELIENAPDIVNPLVGYSILRGLWPSATFTVGATVPTANTIDKVNPLIIRANGQTQLQGIGNGANILQADLAACGPSVVHMIDQILLPFSFDQGPTDAITGTQVQKG